MDFYFDQEKKPLYFAARTAHFGVEVRRNGKRSPFIRARLYVRTNVICGPERRYDIKQVLFGGEYGKAIETAFLEAKKWAQGELKMYSEETELLQRAIQR